MKSISSPHRAVRLTLQLWVLSFILATVPAAQPSAEQLLPADTVAFVSIPDWDKAAAYFTNGPYGKLLQDPSMVPFKTKFLKKFESDLLTPLEGQFGLKFGEYKNLLHGQVTIALTPGLKEETNSFGFLLILDAKDRKEDLAARVAELRKKWVDEGQKIKSEKLREIEVISLLFTSKDLQKTLEKAFPPKEQTKNDPKKPEAPAPEKNRQLLIAQSGSFLFLGTNIKDIDKVLARHGSNSGPSVADQSAFQVQHKTFRESLFMTWVNFQPVLDYLKAQISATPAAPTLVPINRTKILDTLGLAGLKSIGFNLSGTSDGSTAETFLSLAEADRKGIFKLLAFEARDAAPPAFVPAGTVKYTRVRIGGVKAWDTLESLFTGISPQAAGVLQLLLSSLGKDKDPNFDFKRNLIGNLGDDFITYQKAPRSAKQADLNAPPSLFLIGSPKPDQLAVALKAVSSVLPVQAGAAGITEREFQGRKIFSISLPPDAGADPAAKRTFNFAAHAGYLAMTADLPILEEFLRSADGSGKSLKDTPGLVEAAQKIGDMNSGLFTFNNQHETMRSTFSSLKDPAGNGSALLSLLLGSSAEAQEQKSLREWFDYTLLPNFEEISKYFHYSIVNGTITAEGLSFKVFAPTPPGLRGS